MTFPASAVPDRGRRFRPAALAVLGILGALLGAAAAVQVMHGSLIPALCLVPYLGLLCAVWWFTNGNLPVLVMVAYLIAPVPADNLLPQVFIYPQTDLSLRARDLLFLADLVLAGALIAARPPWPRQRLARVWLGCLALLTVYPIVVGLVAGPGQTVAALIQGAMMPLRGIGVIVLVMWWARARGWEGTIRDLGRTLVLCAAAVSAAEVLLVIAAHGQPNFSLGGFPLVVDGRPGLPGWGNNILANFLCTSLAALTFLGARLQWRRRWRVLLGVLLFLGLDYTQVRIAMLLAVAIVEIPLALALVRKLWPRRGPVLAIVGGGIGGAGLLLLTLVSLVLINPRYTTLAPFLVPYLPKFGSGSAVSSITLGASADEGGDSLSTRSRLLRTAIEVWQHNVVVGNGWNGWGWGKMQVSQNLLQPVAVDPHNGFTWLLADTGMVGIVLLYLVPMLLCLRRLDLWWLLTIPVVATALEMVNPNLRNGHFAVLVWAFFAIAFTASEPASRYTPRQLAADGLNWIRGKDAPTPPATPSQRTEAPPAEPQVHPTAPESVETPR
ncbi:MAG: O-Antigen ligase [Cryptosporangiaceae bacterium]|nr:O-Antigen ligase [Cryptosporangiaceae bacterium]